MAPLLCIYLGSDRNSPDYPGYKPCLGTVAPTAPHRSPVLAYIMAPPARPSLAHGRVPQGCSDQPPHQDAPARIPAHGSLALAPVTALPQSTYFDSHTLLPNSPH